MPSNLSTLGFSFQNDAEFQTLMARLAGLAITRLACAPGDYAIWRSRTGAEVWFHVEGDRDMLGHLEDGTLIALTPFFEAETTTTVTLMEALKRPGDNAFEGAFRAVLGGDVETGMEGTALVFDAVDFAAHETRSMPRRSRVRLVGFARKLTTYASEAKATEALEARGIGLSLPCLLPVGLMASAFGDENDDGDGANDNRPPHGAEVPVPSSHALLIGRIGGHRVLTNEETEQQFHWLAVEGPDCTLEILADPELLDGPVAEGMTAEVACAFFGRILD